MRKFFLFGFVHDHLPSRRRYSASGTPYESPALFSRPFAIEHRNLPARGFDETLLDQRIQRLRHAGAAHAEHQREKFVGERNRVAAARSCAIRIQRASRWSIWLRALQIAVWAVWVRKACTYFSMMLVHAGAFCHGLAQGVDGNTLARAAHLDVGLIRRLMVSEHDRNAAHALASDQADFDTGFVRLNGDHRGEPGFGKEDIFDLALRLFRT